MSKAKHTEKTVMYAQSRINWTEYIYIYLFIYIYIYIPNKKQDEV